MLAIFCNTLNGTDSVFDVIYPSMYASMVRLILHALVCWKPLGTKSVHDPRHQSLVQCETGMLLL